MGQVVDIATGAPVQGARVSVAAAEWMSLTNAEGRFILHDLDPGPHRLSVEQLGYRTLVAQVQAGTAAAPLRLGIEPDPIVLEGLEVVSRRFERRRRATGLRVSEFDQHELARSSSTSAAEMLEERIRSSGPSATMGASSAFSHAADGFVPSCASTKPR